jgi:serine/threonine protein kinase
LREYDVDGHCIEISSYASFSEFSVKLRCALESNGPLPSLAEYDDVPIFDLLHETMERLAEFDQINHEDWPHLQQLFEQLPLRDQHEEQVQLIVLESLLLRGRAGQRRTRFDDKFNKFNWYEIARWYGAEDPVICPNSQTLLFEPYLDCDCLNCGMPHTQFGQYLLGEELGKGGMATVYLAYSREHLKIVALKKLWSKNDDSAKHRALSTHLIEEATKAKIVKHNSAVRAYDCGLVEGEAFIAYEYIDGSTLAEQLVKSDRKPLLSPKEAARKFGKLADALAAAHTCGVLHHDIKPANVLIDAKDNYFLTDFGLGSVRTQTYCAPEQLEPDHAMVDERADVYALGLLLHEVTTAQRIEAENLLTTMYSDKFHSLPRDFKAIVEKCLQRQPSKRYASASELADELSRFVDLYPVLARPVGPLTKFFKWCQRQPWTASTIGSAIIIIGCIVFFYLSLAYSKAEKRGLVNKSVEIAVELEVLKKHLNATKETLGVAIDLWGKKETSDDPVDRKLFESTERLLLSAPPKKNPQLQQLTLSLANAFGALARQDKTAAVKSWRQVAEESVSLQADFPKEPVFGKLYFTAVQMYVTLERIHRLEQLQHVWPKVDFHAEISKLESEYAALNGQLKRITENCECDEGEAFLTKSNRFLEETHADEELQLGALGKHVLPEDPGTQNLRKLLDDCLAQSEERYSDLYYETSDPTIQAKQFVVKVHRFLLNYKTWKGDNAKMLKETSHLLSTPEQPERLSHIRTFLTSGEASLSVGYLCKCSDSLAGSLPKDAMGGYLTAKALLAIAFENKEEFTKKDAEIQFKIDRLTH